MKNRFFCGAVALDGQLNRICGSEDFAPRCASPRIFIYDGEVMCACREFTSYVPRQTEVARTVLYRNVCVGRRLDGFLSIEVAQVGGAVGLSLGKCHKEGGWVACRVKHTNLVRNIFLRFVPFDTNKTESVVV